MKYGLVKKVDFDDVLLSKHRTILAAENKMKKMGATPNSMFQKQMRVVELEKYDIIEVFGKTILRPKT